MLSDPEKFGDNAEESFDVIIPSLHGFGFSDCKAMNDAAIADLWVKLMTNLVVENLLLLGVVLVAV